jgi:hypothetical protein
MPKNTELLAGVVGTAALGVGVVLHLPLVAAIVVGGAVYGGVRLMLPPVNPLAKLQQLAAATNHPSVRASVQNICASANEIFRLFESSPRKKLLGAPFVEYTLTRTVDILQRYQTLRSSGQAESLSHKTESLLAMIDQSFREQVAKLLSDDVADLDSEIEVLKTRLEIEGDMES